MIQHLRWLMGGQRRDTRMTQAGLCRHIGRHTATIGQWPVRRGPINRLILQQHLGVGFFAAQVMGEVLADTPSCRFALHLAVYASQVKQTVNLSQWASARLSREPVTMVYEILLFLYAKTIVSSMVASLPAQRASSVRVTGSCRLTREQLGTASLVKCEACACACVCARARARVCVCVCVCRLHQTPPSSLKFWVV